MARTISEQDAKEQLGEMLTRVSATGEPVEIQREGLTLGVLVSAEVYERVRAEARRAFREMVQANWEFNKDVPLAEIEADVDQAIAEVREDRAARRARG
jgi:prevent-host-death family protein